MQNPTQSNKENQQFDTFLCKINTNHIGYPFWLKQYYHNYRQYCGTQQTDSTLHDNSLNLKHSSKKCNIFASFKSSRITHIVC